MGFETQFHWYLSLTLKLDAVVSCTTDFSIHEKMKHLLGIVCTTKNMLARLRFRNERHGPMLMLFIISKLARRLASTNHSNLHATNGAAIQSLSEREISARFAEHIRRCHYIYSFVFTLPSVAVGSKYTDRRTFCQINATTGIDFIFICSKR